MYLRTMTPGAIIGLIGLLLLMFAVVSVFL